MGGVVVQANPVDQKLRVPETAVKLGAHGIELKIGQGAKQGLGGEIKFFDVKDVKKYEGYGYMVIPRKDGSFERHTPPGSLSKENLRELLIKYSALEVPIWIKIGVGRDIIKFLKLCQKIKKKDKVLLQAVTIDGHGGGTGMSPWILMNEICLPSISILSKVSNMNFDFDVLVAGGFANGVDVAKALMLGADGVAMARPMIISSVNGSDGIVNYVKSMKEELQMVAATQRLNSVKKLKNRRNNLVALSPESAILFNLKETL